jgi:AraC-like DNA-binding protein
MPGNESLPSLDARGGAYVEYAPPVATSALAVDAGYYDQSHLIADVKALTGLTPDVWIAERV